MENKTEITIEELLKIKGITLSTLAGEMGCSISLLSRIKNGTIAVTPETQDLFQQSYPNYILTNGAVKWKELYLKEQMENQRLNDFIAEQKEVINNLTKATNFINKVAEEPLKEVKKVIKKIKGFYESNKEDLKEIENFINTYGYLNNGLTDASESFEQGYNNALEQVISLFKNLKLE